MTRLTRRARVLPFTVAIAVAIPLSAQDTTTVPPNASTARHRFASRGAMVAVATLATIPFDARLARAMRGPAIQRNGSLRSAARTFDAAGDPGALVASALMYGAGRTARSERLTRIGLHAGEAVVIAGTTTSLLKLVAGRQRPYAAPGDADDFTPLRVSGAHTSFPSGHTTVAFAFASAVTAELAAENPRSAWIAGPLLYTGASLVGVARMYDDKHWASDVVLAAGIGTLAGIETVAFSRTRPHNRVERLLGSMNVGPSAHGATLMLSLHP